MKSMNENFYIKSSSDGVAIKNTPHSVFNIGAEKSRR